MEHSCPRILTHACTHARHSRRTALRHTLTRAFTRTHARTQKNERTRTWVGARTHALITTGAHALAGVHARKRARTPTYTRTRTQARTQARTHASVEGMGSSLPADRARQGRWTSTCQSVPAPRHSAHTRRPPPAPRPRAAGRLMAGGMHGHAALVQTHTYARTHARARAYTPSDGQTGRHNCPHARAHTCACACTHAFAQPGMQMHAETDEHTLCGRRWVLQFEGNNEYAVRALVGRTCIAHRAPGKGGSPSSSLSCLFVAHAHTPWVNPRMGRPPG